MINKIFTDYKNTFSFKNNYFKYFKKSIIIFSITILVLEIVAFVLLSLFFSLNWIIMLIVVPGITIIIILDYEIKRIVKVQYKCKSRKEVNKLFKINFEKCLKSNYIDINNLEQLDYLIELIEQNSEELKPGLYIKGGILAGILGPLWISYVTTIFKYTNSIDEATKVFLGLIVLFAIIYSLYFNIKQGLIDEILYSDYYKMKLLRNLIKEYRLINMNIKFPYIPNA